MPAPPKSWPSGALPRRMTRENAAYYCGLSGTSFDARVKTGEFPKPGSDKRYDLKLIDAALDRMAGLDKAPPVAPDNWSVPTPPPPRAARPNNGQNRT